MPELVDTLLIEVVAVAADAADGAAEGAVDRATDELTALYKACRQSHISQLRLILL